MQIQSVTLDNLSEDQLSYPFFNVSSLQANIISLMGLIENKPVIYGSLFKEDKVWLRIYISEFQHQYNKIMLTSLLNAAKAKNISEIYVSLNYDDYNSKTLYLEHGFQLFESIPKFDIMKLIIQEIMYLPISIGEALDKLSILDIKLNKIKDSRLLDLTNEYSLLSNKLQPIIIKSQFYYKILKETNLKIWNIQDKFQESQSECEKKKIAEEIFVENYKRFLIKQKINNINNSYLKEQKGYDQKIAIFYGSYGLGDQIHCSGIVRYLSCNYDKVIVVIKSSTSTLANLHQLFGDDSSIEFVDCSSEIDKYGEKCDIYLAGLFNKNRNDYWYQNRPFEFFEDVNIPINCFLDYFYFPENPKSKRLLSVLDGKPYIFIHNESSFGFDFDCHQVVTKLNLGFDPDKILFLNPNLNLYLSDHPFYSLAQEFLGHLIFDYVDLMIHSQAIILVDSSFFCLATLLPLQTDQCYYYGRLNRNYNHLFEPEILKNGRKKFIQFNNLL